MISVLVVLCLLALMGALLAHIGTTEIGTVANFYEGISAQYIAEAGLRRGLVVFIGNGDPNGISEVIPIQGQLANYAINVSLTGSRTRIRSIGCVGGARRTASIEVSRASQFPFSDYVIFSAGSLDLAGDVMFQGPLVAGGSVVTSEGTVSFTSPVEKSRVAFPQLLLPVDNQPGNLDQLNQEIFLSGKTIVDNHTVLLLEGSSTHIKGPGILWARGDVIIRGATIDEGAIIISEGNIRIEDHSRLVSTFIASPKGWIDVLGDGIYLSGAIWARDHIGINVQDTLFSPDPVAVKSALGRLGVSESMNQPYIIHAWGI